MTTQPAPLSRDIGQTERTLRALLDQVLDEADLSFPEWTVLFSLGAAGPLPRSELISRQVDGRVTSDDEAEAVIAGLRSSGLVAPADQRAGDDPDPRLALTETGEALYRPLWSTVSGISEEIHRGLSPADLDTTRRTLAELTRRATARLAATSK